MPSRSVSACPRCAMLALTPSGARVIRAMTQLAYVFDHHLHPMRIAFRQMTAGKIARQFVIDQKSSALDKFARFAGTAVKIRRQAVVSGELKAAWDASSAAAGSMMLFAKAREDMEATVELPHIR